METKTVQCQSRVAAFQDNNRHVFDQSNQVNPAGKWLAEAVSTLTPLDALNLHMDMSCGYQIKYPVNSHLLEQTTLVIRACQRKHDFVL